MHDALEVRDRWESRILRSARLVAALLSGPGRPDVWPSTGARGPYDVRGFDLARTFVHLGSAVPPRPRCTDFDWSPEHVEAYRERASPQTGTRGG